MSTAATQTLDVEEKLKSFHNQYLKVMDELSKSIVGQKDVIDHVLLTAFAGGHALVTGVPGLAKTRMIAALSRVLDLSFNRIQFTPDLMPSDITGTDVIEEDSTTGKRALQFIEGPIFANVILADEINRTPPKTQAAMLQAMQERQVSVGKTTYDLPSPFFVFATQNPLEMEGTYVLPEAQADRFMFCIEIGYPTIAEEAEVVKQTTGLINETPEVVLTKKDIEEIQYLVKGMPVSDEVVDYAVRLVAASRPENKDLCPENMAEYIHWGCSPRASQYLILGAKARAALDGEICVQYKHVKQVAFPVMRHRIVTNFKARAAKVTAGDVVHEILNSVKHA